MSADLKGVGDILDVRWPIFDVFRIHAFEVIDHQLGISLESFLVLGRKHDQLRLGPNLRALKPET